MKFHERIKELRKELKIPQVKMAIDLGTQRYSVGDWETGRGTPNLEMLIKLAEYFHVSVDYLIGRDKFFGCENCKHLPK
ncbi:MAG: helix-turn-helix domain-containing protein [Firmicutes bacterium]|nr:helix-turn-helix domain-containing protein [Bacillota bacterium]